MDDHTQVFVSILDPESKPSNSAGLTREFVATLNRLPGIDATLPETEAEPGYRGPPLSGEIILQLIASGGVVVTLINVLRSYFDRKPSLEFELTRKDGTSLKLKAENFNEQQIASFTEQLRLFLGADPQ